MEMTTNNVLRSRLKTLLSIVVPGPEEYGPKELRENAKEETKKAKKPGKYFFRCAFLRISIAARRNKTGWPTRYIVLMSPVLKIVGTKIDKPHMRKSMNSHRRYNTSLCSSSFSHCFVFFNMVFVKSFRAVSDCLLFWKSRQFCKNSEKLNRVSNLTPRTITEPRVWTVPWLGVNGSPGEFRTLAKYTSSIFLLVKSCPDSAGAP